MLRKKRGVNGGDLSGVSDAALVVRIARFDETAFAEVYRRHAGAVYGLASVLVGPGSKAEDVAQEVFVELWQSPEKYDPERGTLRAYLIAKTHSKAIDALRSERARRTREQRYVENQVIPEPDVAEKAEAVVAAESVRLALMNLPDGEREAITLAYFRGLSYREVAEVLGEPEGTVKTRIRRGLSKLKELLGHLSEHQSGSEKERGHGRG